MDLDRDFMLQFAKTALKLSAKQDAEQIDGVKYISCNLGDVTFMVRLKPMTFTGSTFTAYGLEWIVDEDCKVYLLSFQGKKTPVGDEMGPLVQDYLRHRYFILENYSI